jgi:hypothetical protein
VVGGCDELRVIAGPAGDRAAGPALAHRLGGLALALRLSGVGAFSRCRCVREALTNDRIPRSRRASGSRRGPRRPSRG